MTAEEEGQRIERWHTERFIELGFDFSEREMLLAWKIDPHDAEKLLRRNGQPTSCTTAQALRILQPLDDIIVLTAEPELALA